LPLRLVLSTYRESVWGTRKKLGDLASSRSSKLFPHATDERASSPGSRQSGRGADEGPAPAGGAVVPRIGQGVIEVSSSVVDDMCSRGEWIEWGIGRPASIRVGWAWALRGAGSAGMGRAPGRASAPAPPPPHADAPHPSAVVVLSGVHMSVKGRRVVGPTCQLTVHGWQTRRSVV